MNRLPTEDERPVLVYGKCSCTFYMKEHFDIDVFIDSTTVTDIKSLLTQFSIVGGKFTSADGILLHAVKNGQRIAFTKVDQNPKLYSFIKQFFKSRFYQSSSGLVKMNPRFRLFVSADTRISNRYCIAHEAKYTVREVVSFYTSFNHESIEKIIRLLYKKEFADETTKQVNYAVRNTHHVFKRQLRGQDDRARAVDCVTGVLLSHLSVDVRKEVLKEFATIFYIKPSVCDRVIPSLVRTSALSSVLKSLEQYSGLGVPVLLVGETGTGKTSLVQAMHRDVVIYNMSADTDISDLIGGFVTVNNKEEINTCKKTLRMYLKGVEFEKIEAVECLRELIQNLGNFSNDKFEIESSKVIIESTLARIDGRIQYREGILVKAIRDGGVVLLDELNLAPRECINFVINVMKHKEIHVNTTAGLERIPLHKEFILYANMNPANDFYKKSIDSLVFGHVYYDDILLDYEDLHYYIIGKLNQYRKINTGCNFLLDDGFLRCLSKFFHELKRQINDNTIIGTLLPITFSCRTLDRFCQMICGRVDMKDALEALFSHQLHFNSKEKFYSLIDTHIRVYLNTVNTSFKLLANQGDFLIYGKTFEKIIQAVQICIRFNYPILLQGTTGTGKTSVIQYLAKCYGVRLNRINNHEHTDSTDYLGTFSVDLQFKPGILLKAIREGEWILLDELNLAPSDVLEVLNRLLDSNNEIYDPETCRNIKPHADFRLFATQNVGYSGRKNLSKAFRNRFVEIQFEKHSKDELMKICKHRSKLPKSFLAPMVEVYQKLSTLRSFNCLMTLRDLLRWTQRCLTEIQDVFNYGLSIVYEKTRGARDKRLVCEIFEGVFELSIESYHTWIHQTVFQPRDNFLWTKTHGKIFNLISYALDNKESVLLIGTTGIGKTTLVDVVCEIRQRQLFTFCAHADTDASDLIGHFVLPLRWVDGPMTTALKTMDSVLFIDEVNLCNDAVLERFNVVLDGDDLYIPDICETVDNCGLSLIACMNPGDDFGKKELSDAFRNRFVEIYVDLEPEEVIDIIRFRTRADKNMIEQLTALHLSTRELLSRASHLCDLANGVSEYPIFLSNDPGEVLSGWNVLNGMVGLYPYFLETTKLPELMMTKTASRNIYKFLEALSGKRSVLIIGPVGTGKTYISEIIADMCSKKIYRVNLSKETEMSDLVGTYMPTSEGFAFRTTPLVDHIVDGHFILLDEVNLATQSVLEGLNSLLDHRRTLYCDGNEYLMHPEARIICAMNFEGVGRNRLPRSFLDRFSVITFEDYNASDIREIVGSDILPDTTLRHALIAKKSNIIDSAGLYSSERDRFVFESNADLQFAGLQENGLFVPSDRRDALYKLVMCLNSKIPVILNRGFGRYSLVRLAASLLKLDVVVFDCHAETDASDFVGCFNFVDGKIEWEDSVITSNLERDCIIVINRPELAEPGSLDRLNSVFESTRKLIIYENGGIVKNVLCGIVCVTDGDGLSEAIRDRCYTIDIKESVNEIDWLKMRKSETVHVPIENSLSEVAITNLFELTIGHLPVMVYDPDLRQFACERLCFPRIEFDEIETKLLNVVTDRMIEFYQKIRSRPRSTDLEKIHEMSSGRFVDFIRHKNISFFRGEITSVPHFVREVIHYVGNSTYDVLDEVNTIINLLRSVLICPESIDPYFYEFLDSLNGVNPSYLLSIQVKREYNRTIDEVNLKIMEEFVRLYKYGESTLKDVYDAGTEIAENVQADVNSCFLHDETECLKFYHQIGEFTSYPADRTTLYLYALLATRELTQDSVVNEGREYFYQQLQTFGLSVGLEASSYIETGQGDVLLELLNAEEQAQAVETQVSPEMVSFLNARATNILGLVLQSLLDFEWIPYLHFSGRNFSRFRVLNSFSDKRYKLKDIPEHIMEKQKIYRPITFTYRRDYNGSLMLRGLRGPGSYEAFVEYFCSSFNYVFLERMGFAVRFFELYSNVTLYRTMLLLKAYEIEERCEKTKNLGERSYHEILSKKTAEFLKDTPVLAMDKDYCICRDGCAMSGTLESQQESPADIFMKKLPQSPFSLQEKCLGVVMCLYLQLKKEKLSLVVAESMLCCYLTNDLCCNYLKLIYVELRKNILYDDVTGCGGLEGKCEGEQEGEKDKDDVSNEDGEGMSGDENEGLDNDDIEGRKGLENAGEEDKKNGDLEEVNEDENENMEEEDRCSEGDESGEKIEGEECSSMTESDGTGSSESGSTTSTDDGDGNEKDEEEEVENYDTNKHNLRNYKSEEFTPNAEQRTNAEVENYDTLVPGDGNADETAGDTAGENNEGMCGEDGELDANYGCGKNMRSKDEELAQNSALSYNPDKRRKVYEVPDVDVLDIVNILSAIIVPNKKSKYQGAYRTGKKLNIRKIIPYIASGYKKDRIFSRKDNNQREYKVRLFIDNSTSIERSCRAEEIIRCACKLSKALKILNIESELYSFGGDSVVRLDGVSDLERMEFRATSTGLKFIENPDFSGGINLVISDGVFQTDTVYKGNFLVLILTEDDKIKNLQRVFFIEDTIYSRCYVDLLNVKYCFVKEGCLEEDFWDGLKFMIENYI